LLFLLLSHFSLRMEKETQERRRIGKEEKDRLLAHLSITLTTSFILSSRRKKEKKEGRKEIVEGREEEKKKKKPSCTPKESLYHSFHFHSLR